MIVSNVAVYSIQEATPEGRIVTLALLILGLAIISGVVYFFTRRKQNFSLESPSSSSLASVSMTLNIDTKWFNRRSHSGAV